MVIRVRRTASFFITCASHMQWMWWETRGKNRPFLFPTSTSRSFQLRVLSNGMLLFFSNWIFLLFVFMLLLLGLFSFCAALYLPFLHQSSSFSFVSLHHCLSLWLLTDTSLCSRWSINVPLWPSHNAPGCHSGCPRHVLVSHPLHYPAAHPHRCTCSPWATSASLTAIYFSSVSAFSCSCQTFPTSLVQ